MNFDEYKKPALAGFLIVGWGKLLPDVKIALLWTKIILIHGFVLAPLDFWSMTVR